jgi:hypothetical protein
MIVPNRGSQRRQFVLRRAGRRWPGVAALTVKDAGRTTRAPRDRSHRASPAKTSQLCV